MSSRMEQFGVARCCAIHAPMISILCQTVAERTGSVLVSRSIASTQVVAGLCPLRSSRSRVHCGRLTGCVFLRNRATGASLAEVRGVIELVDGNDPEGVGDGEDPRVLSIVRLTFEGAGMNNSDWSSALILAGTPTSPRSLEQQTSSPAPAPASDPSA